MINDLSNYRKTYQKGELLKANVPKAPFHLFEEWFKEAETQKNGTETNAMNIASIGLDGFPKNRIVLLKRFTEEGFIFYTNYNSEKGKAIANPEGSKLGAWASNQSNVVDSKNVLNEQLNDVTEQFKDKEIPRPKHWGGYIIKPISIEFWQGRPNRMHDRIRYSLLENFEWKIERLAP